MGSNFLQMVFYKFKGECIIRTPDILEIKKKYRQTGILRMKMRTIIIAALSLTIGMMFLRADLSRASLAETGKTTSKSFLKSELIFSAGALAQSCIEHSRGVQRGPYRLLVQRFGREAGGRRQG
ncbi:MAG: hypothetical protein IPO77_20765 [Acidobacteria bacterium]|nr:hypothetical protein [Acidobacteriota bacterium]